MPKKFYIEGLTKNMKYINSRDFSSLQKAVTHAKKLQKKKKIIQAKIWDNTNRFNQRIAGSLNLSGKFVEGQV